MFAQVIDDNEPNLFVLGAIIRKLGLEVETHYDARQGLMSCRERIPDLIVVDYMMPWMNGVDYIRAVRELPDSSHAVILLVTASRDDSLREAAVTAGANGFLPKPVRVADMKAKLAELNITTL